MPATQPLRRRRLEPDTRREEILAAAIRLFGERPYAEVSTSDIAEAAGITRGLMHHYFGTKRELYVEVVRAMVTWPAFTGPDVAPGSIKTRVESSVTWLLDIVAAHGKTFIAVTGAEGISDDPVIEQIIRKADDATVSAVLDILGIPKGKRTDAQRAVIHSYGGLFKIALREWIIHKTLTRDQVEHLLSQALLAIARDVLPDL